MTFRLKAFSDQHLETRRMILINVFYIWDFAVLMSADRSFLRRVGTDEGSELDVFDLKEKVCRREAFNVKVTGLIQEVSVTSDPSCL